MDLKASAQHRCNKKFRISFPLARDGQLLRRQIVRRRVGNISTVGDWGWLYRDNVHGLRGANIVIFECIVHKAINPVCTTCITNVDFLETLEWPDFEIFWGCQGHNDVKNGINGSSCTFFSGGLLRPVVHRSFSIL